MDRWVFWVKISAQILCISRPWFYIAQPFFLQKADIFIRFTGFSIRDWNMDLFCRDLRTNHHVSVVCGSWGRRSEGSFILTLAFGGIHKLRKQKLLNTLLWPNDPMITISRSLIVADVSGFLVWCSFLKFWFDNQLQISHIIINYRFLIWYSNLEL